MFKNFLIFLYFLGFSLYAGASEKVPRQLIVVSGKKLNPSIQTKFRVDYLESLKLTSSAELLDPYQKNQKLKFEGIMLEDLFNHFSKSAKMVKVVAINGYEITIKRDAPNAKTLLFAFKQDSKYIGVKIMGPLRIVRIGLGLITEERLILEGIDWVWMVKELVFE